MTRAAEHIANAASAMRALLNRGLVVPGRVYELHPVELTVQPEPYLPPETRLVVGVAPRYELDDLVDERPRTR